MLSLSELPGCERRHLGQSDGEWSSKTLWGIWRNPMTGLLLSAVTSMHLHFGTVNAVSEQDSQA
jgi:hypothetical protein